MHNKILFIVLFLLLNAASEAQQIQKVTVAPGAEDMAIDTINTEARIILSCMDRRNKNGQGQIQYFSIEKQKVFTFKRINEPEGLCFNPHGIDLCIGKDGKKRLYVISHRDTGTIKEQSILIYEVLKDQLVYEAKLNNPKVLISPNDLCVNADGKIYFSNDGSSRSAYLEHLLNIKKASVGYYDGKNWQIVAKRLSYPNGVVTKNNTLYISTSRQNKVFSYDIATDGKLTNRKKIVKIKGGDNLLFNGDDLYTTSHYKAVKFLKHATQSGKKSPCAAWKIDVKNKSKIKVFDNKGELISGASTALKYKNKLYLSQIFEDFILIIE